MKDPVYKLIELTGTSTTSIEDAVDKAVKRAYKGDQVTYPAGLRERLHLTDEQKAELKPIEDNFANTSRQYQVVQSTVELMRH